MVVLHVRAPALHRGEPAPRARREGWGVRGLEGGGDQPHFGLLVARECTHPKQKPLLSSSPTCVSLSVIGVSRKLPIDQPRWGTGHRVRKWYAPAASERRGRATKFARGLL